MNGLLASLAVVRRSADGTLLIKWTAAFLGGAALGATMHIHPSLPVLVAAVAVVAAVGFGATLRVRDLVFFEAPLYGRQLARALAITAVLGAVMVPLGAACTAPRSDVPSLASDLWAAVATTLIATSSTLRTAAAARIYVALALGLGASIVGLAWAWNGSGFALAWSLAAAGGFFGLRGFGETLARYDPV